MILKINQIIPQLFIFLHQSIISGTFKILFFTYPAFKKGLKFELHIEDILDCIISKQTTFPTLAITMLSG